MKIRRSLARLLGITNFIEKSWRRLDVDFSLITAKLDDASAKVDDTSAKIDATSAKIEDNLRGINGKFDETENNLRLITAKLDDASARNEDYLTGINGKLDEAEHNLGRITAKVDDASAKFEAIALQRELDRATTLDLLEVVTIMMNLQHEQVASLQRLENLTREALK